MKYHFPQETTCYFYCGVNFLWKILTKSWSCEPILCINKFLINSCTKIKHAGILAVSWNYKQDFLFLLLALHPFYKNIKLLCLKMHGRIMQVLKQQFASEIPPMHEFLHGEAHVWLKQIRIKFLTQLDVYFNDDPILSLILPVKGN